MTSINMISLDNNRAVLLCDEASYWNEEWMILYTPDKIQSVLDSRLLERHRTVFFIGMAGSSFMGERVMDGLYQWSRKLVHSQEKYQSILPPGKDFTRQCAFKAFELACDVKQESMNDFLLSRFGFNYTELLAGSYTRNGKTISIEDEAIQKEVLALVTFQNESPEVAHLFKNTLCLAGFNPQEGMKLYFISLATPVCEEVAEIYITGGSGTDTTDLVYSHFAQYVPLLTRRDGLDPVEAAITAFSGLTTAFTLTAGVAPYPNYIFIDGTSEEVMTKIFDNRSKLVSEAVLAHHRGLLSPQHLRVLVRKVLFEAFPFGEANEYLMENARDRRELELFLRGYYIDRKSGSALSPVARTVG